MRMMHHSRRTVDGSTSCSARCLPCLETALFVFPPQQSNALSMKLNKSTFTEAYMELSGHILYGGFLFFFFRILMIVF